MPFLCDQLLISHLDTMSHFRIESKRANKMDPGNGSNGICRVIDASRSLSPDPKLSTKKQSQSPLRRNKSKHPY